ncbi:MAG TPA: hypothetical protein VF872_02945 [Gaiellaceae bacterium]
MGAALAAVLCLAGCGGGGSEHRAAPQPRLPQPVAAALASRSDEVARALSAGDPCRALSVALQLQRETVAAINAGRIPGAFQEQLGSTVGDLVSRLQCVPVEKMHGREHKSKHKKHGEGD